MQEGGDSPTGSVTGLSYQKCPDYIENLCMSPNGTLREASFVAPSAA